MKYLKYFKTDVDCQNYFSSDEFVTPNVSYVEGSDTMYCKPIKSATSTIYATYSATDDNKLAIADTSNVKSLKVNGNSVSFGDAYYFESNGEYEVEIELIDDSVINGLILDENDNVLSFPMFSNGEFGSCLTSITIPDSVTSIGDCVFIRCNGLTSITIPDSVTSIGESAFFDCNSLPAEDNLRYADRYLIGAVDTSLSTYTIKKGTKWIGDSAFNGCSNLTSITIPDSVTSIGGGVFFNCSSLTSITIPDSVTSIGEGAFDSCYGLTSINIPDSVTYIGNSAFIRCSGLTSVHIGSGVTSIGSDMFCECYSLTSINIPDSVTSIGEGAFHSCESLPVENGLCYADTYLVGAVDASSTYTIKEGTKWIGDRAFDFRPNLTSINIPNSVISIGKGAFESCYGLTSINIPDSVTSIREYAFTSCSKLNEITCLATTAPSIDNTTFQGIKQNGLLKVPAGSDYSSWMSTGDYYLGKYYWTTEEF